MGIPVLILGHSGSGKSSALRTFASDEIGILNVASKPLPFRGARDMMVINHADYPKIHNSLRRGKLKAYAIDDSQYLMVFDMFNRMNEKGYEKFTAFAKNFYDLVRTVIDGTPDDCIVYFLHHLDETESGMVKAKTVGRMLDDKLTLEGIFSIVLIAHTDGRKHVFLTQSNGRNPAKSPMEMFDSVEIPNDLKMVDNTIRDYYGLSAAPANEPQD